MLIAFDKALEMVLSAARPSPSALVPLGKATGLCLAEDIRADRDQPPADRSAMDGYAVLAADVAGASAQAEACRGGGGGRLRLAFGCERASARSS